MARTAYAASLQRVAAGAVRSLATRDRNDKLQLAGSNPFFLPNVPELCGSSSQDDILTVRRRTGAKLYEDHVCRIMQRPLPSAGSSFQSNARRLCPDLNETITTTGRFKPSV
jgi:hypothetical protein